MSFTQAYDSTRRSLTSMIGWLSLCLLAAGWGAQLDSTVTQIWVNVGLFGLTSAVGLEVVQRKRLSHRRRKQRRASHRRTERSLTTLTAENASFEQLFIALHQITKDDQDSDRRLRERRSETRLLLHHPVQVKLLANNERPLIEEDRITFTAFIQNISAAGVGLIHDQPIPTGRAMLTFTLDDGETTSIVAELLWEHHQPDGKYLSGGKLIEVINPVCPPEPVTMGLDDELLTAGAN